MLFIGTDSEVYLVNHFPKKPIRNFSWIFGPMMQKDQIDLTRFENLDNCKNDLGEMSSETQNKGYSVGSERGAKKKKFAIGGGVAVLAVLGSLF